jgi:hypothetical protein
MDVVLSIPKNSPLNSSTTPNASNLSHESARESEKSWTLGGRRESRHVRALADTRQLLALVPKPRTNLVEFCKPRPSENVENSDEKRGKLP